MLREKRSGEIESPLKKSINAEHRGGSSRNSDEVSVMEMEQRGRPVQLDTHGQPNSGRSHVEKAKPYYISKHLVVEAFKRVKSNKGRSGVDGQSISDFERDLKNNLYKIWNRLSSGSYHPPAVLRAEIGKPDGSIRTLGIPTVSDRVAQMVLKLLIEPELEQHFHPNSFGYRPGKSAKDALQLADQRCRKRAWVLDMDIKGFFDAIDHDILLGYVKRHVKESWQLIYIERWLKAPMEDVNGNRESRDRGTPQGGVISPLLANLYLHYVFDMWVENDIWGDIQFERYADDIVCHCTTQKQAIWLKEAVERRFAQHSLELHPIKSKIVYCKSQYRLEDCDNVSFKFLSYTFRPHWSKTKSGHYGLYFYGEVSRESEKAIRDEINRWPWRHWCQKEIRDIQAYAKSKLRGWINYFSAFGVGAIKNVLFHFDRRLSRWAKMKYKGIRSLRNAADRVNQARRNNPHWFAHWFLI